MKIQHNYKITLPLCPVNKTVMAHFMKEKDKPTFTTLFRKEELVVTLVSG